MINAKNIWMRANRFFTALSAELAQNAPRLANVLRDNAR